MKPGTYGKKPSTVPTAAAPASDASADGPQATPQASPQPTFTPEQWTQNFNSCLELLAGPTDEKRFVGLLLAVRLLPQGGDAAIRQVISALGWRFIARLLLPLNHLPTAAQVAPAPPPAHAAQQAELTCGLGLSVLSAACRLPDLAASPTALDLIPTLAAVVVQGGVGPQLGLRPTHSTPAPAPSPHRPPQAAPGVGAADGQAAEDAATVAEALEALVAMGCAGGRGAHAALLAGGALAAGTAELERLVWSSRQGAAQQRGQVREQGGTSGWARGVLAARLLGLLLGPEQLGWPGMQEQEEALSVAVPALGHVLGMPTIVANKLFLDQRQQQEHANGGGPGPQGPGGAPPAPQPAAARPAAAAAGDGDGAMLQLECLHTLLLLMPPPAPGLQRLRSCLAATAYHEHNPAAHGDVPQGLTGTCGRGAAAASVAVQSGWALAARRGLGWLLRSRAGPTQKHSALRLAAAMTELLGPEWLLQQPPLPPRLPASPSPDVREVPFLCVLAEILHVECSLLLHDALHAQAPVWGEEPGQRGHTRDTWQAPQPSSGLVQELEARVQAAMDTDGAANDNRSQPASAGLLSCGPGEPLQEHAQRYASQQAQQLQRPGVSNGEAPAVTGGGADSDGDRGGVGGGPVRDGPAQTAGRRAAHMLPVALMLVEAVVEALASDAAAEEEAAQGGGAGGLGAGAAQQVLAALERVTAEVVAFLEVVAELQQQQHGDAVKAEAASRGSVLWATGGQASQPQQQQQQQQQQGTGGGANAGAQQAFAHAAQHKPPSAMQLVEGVCVPESMQARLPAPELVLACVRVVGRFLADVPDGHTPAMRRVLPFMLCVGSPGSPGAAAPGVVPSGSSGGGSGSGIGAGVGAEAPGGAGGAADAEGTAVRFLLPGLLQATSSLSPEAMELRSSIAASPAALSSLVATLAACCEQAASLAGAPPHGVTPAAPAPAPAAPAPAAAAAAAPAQACTSLGWGTHAAELPGYTTSGHGHGPLLPSAQWWLQQLDAVEQLLADTAMLLVNLLDPIQAAPAAPPEHCGLLGDGAHSAQPPPHSSIAGLSAGLGVRGALGPATCALLPAVRSLAGWARSRGLPLLRAAGGANSGGGCGGGSGLQGARLLPPGQVVALLCHAWLKPRALLCGGHLCALVLRAAVQQAGGRVSGQRGVDGGSAHSLAVLVQEELLEQEARGVAGQQPGVRVCGDSHVPGGMQSPVDMDEVATPQAPRVLHDAAALVASALLLGTSLVAGLVAEEAQPGACTLQAAAVIRAAAAGVAAAAPPLAADAVLADVSGDGEVCWERVACVVAHHPELLVVAGALKEQGEAGACGAAAAPVQVNRCASALTHAQGGWEEAQGQLASVAPWLAQLLQAQAGKGGSGWEAALGEVVAQSVGLRLLLAMLRAQAV